MAKPAYDPATGKPIFDPATGKPALNCGGCTCPDNIDSCPSTFTVTVSGLTGGIGCTNCNQSFTITKSGIQWLVASGICLFGGGAAMYCDVIGGVPKWVLTAGDGYAGWTAYVDMDVDCLCPVPGTYEAIGGLNCTGVSGSVAIS